MVFIPYSVFGFGIRVILASKCVRKVSSSSVFKSLSNTGVNPSLTV